MGEQKIKDMESVCCRQAVLREGIGSSDFGIIERNSD